MNLPGALSTIALLVAILPPGSRAQSPASASTVDEASTQALPLSLPDPCALGEVVANPTRPNWDTSASTTQCGVVETDYGWLDQSMGAGVRQQMLVSSLRYGLTPRLDLRWGLTNHMSQAAEEPCPLRGQATSG